MTNRELFRRSSGFKRAGTLSAISHIDYQRAYAEASRLRAAEFARLVLEPIGRMLRAASLRMRAYRHKRSTIRALSSLNDRTLKDIGLHRSEIMRVAHKLAAEELARERKPRTSRGSLSPREARQYPDNPLSKGAQTMQLLRTPIRLRAAGHVEKSIFEYVGRMSGDASLSVARMESPAGWSEPGQRPTFREITLVISGVLRVETEARSEIIRAGEAIICEPGEWVRYSTPDEPAEYVAICTPAFSPELVNRDPDTSSIPEAAA